METTIKTKRPNTSDRKVAFYLRCSTEEQNENPEGTIKNQEERLALTLKLKNQAGSGLGTYSATYCDIKSGKDMKRPEFKRLLRDIEQGHINVVMVTEVSRISRSLKDFTEVWEFMQKHDCKILSLREDFDTTTAAGEMMLYSIANFAQFERRQTSERVSANFEARAKRGLWNGGCLPMGYEPDPVNRGSLRIVEDEAVTVRAAFDALITHGSVTNACKWLNENQHNFGTELRGGGGKSRLKHFTFDSLFRMLKNKVYIGVRTFKTKEGLQEGVGAWPPMIDLEIFNDAQRVLLAGKKTM